MNVSITVVVVIFVRNRFNARSVFPSPSYIGEIRKDVFVCFFFFGQYCLSDRRTRQMLLCPLPGNPIRYCVLYRTWEGKGMAKRRRRTRGMRRRRGGDRI